MIPKKNLARGQKKSGRPPFLLLGFLLVRLSVGCTSEEAVVDVNHESAETIHLLTRGGQELLLTEYEADTLGNIRGKGAYMNPWRKFEGVIPGDSVLSITATRFDPGNTLLLVAGGGVAACSVAAFSSCQPGKSSFRI